ncbi:MAG: methionine--tRNA ligase subunit beta [Candidatus Aenigmarchaeota archaeon]|nr:methionine--tRNA ligase subunit beta [Candidatus Aenigmarchaeota archaeon]
MKETINFGDWQKLDIRIAKIIKAEDIEGADKLYKLTISLGDEERTLAAGIKDSYSKEELEGSQIVVLANLEPKELKGVLSQGMLLAADSDGKPFLLKPDKEVPEGTEVM